MIPSTVERVPQHTAEHINEQIRRQTEENIARYAGAGKQAIERRLAELDREWDIERALEANAATAVLVGVTLGTAVDRRFLFLPAVVAGFLVMAGPSRSRLPGGTFPGSFTSGPVRQTGPTGLQALSVSLPSEDDSFSCTQRIDN